MDALRNLLRSYEAVALVANSDAANLQEYCNAVPPNTLFVFFNEASRVLSTPFERPSIVVARSGKEGPAIVRKGKMTSVLACFRPGALKAIVDLRVADRETFVPAERFGFEHILFLDLCDYFVSRYTETKTASSGYAMLVWLASQELGGRIFGFGFTGRRSEKWRIFDVHDWSLERIGLRMIERSGAAILDPSSLQLPSAIESLANQFPDVDRSLFVEAGFEVLSQRIARTDLFVDRLWSVTRVGRATREVMKIFRKRKGVEL